MIVTVDQSEATPVYLQLVRQFTAAVASGELPRGEKLPSVRSLAQDLGINLHTVNKAYAMLVEQGLFESRGNKGTFVAPDAAEKDRTAPVRDAVGRDIAALAARWLALGGTKDSFTTLCDDIVAAL